MALAPVGTLKDDKKKADEAVAFLDGLVQVSNEMRSKREPAADRNLNLFLGNHWREASDCENVEQLTVNRILNAVISQVAIQTEETPKTKFTPRESLEPPVYFINTNLDTTPKPELLSLLASIPDEAKQPHIDPETGEERLPRPLLPDEVQMVEMAIDASATVAQQLGLEPTIPPDILVGITDRVAAEELQVVYDALWEQCEADFKIGENQLFSGIIGWQWILCEWDDDEQTHTLRNVPFLQVHVDPLCTNVKDAQFVIYDQVMSADEAAAKYPEIEAAIREKAMPGQPQPAGAAYRQSSIYNLNFVQDMVCVRTGWLRNQPVPLTPEEAEAKGLIEVVTDNIEIPTECTCGVGVDKPVSLHHETCPCREGYEFNPETLSTPDAPAPDPDQPPVETPPDDGMRIPTQSRTETFTSYKLVETGEVIEEGGKGWPTRPILRQMRAVAGELVDDRICEYADIPMALNINIPIPFTPYGKGDPQHLEGLQMALNSVISDMVTHWHFHAQPAEVIPQSVNELQKPFAQEMYTHMAGTKFVVPDEIIQRLQGKLSFYIDPPKAPTDGWQLINLLLRLLDDASENAEVLQGKASPSWSGEAINSLQNAAKGVIGWKSRRLEYVIKHLAKIKASNIIHRMTLDEKMRYARRYPRQVWAYLDQYQKQHLEYDISVEVVSGTGATRKADQASDLSLFDRGVLSKTTLLESVGKDSKIERHNQIQEAREDASAKAQIPQLAPQVAPVQAQPAPQQPPQQPTQAA